VTFFGKWKTSPVKKYIFVFESVTFLREKWPKWRVTYSSFVCISAYANVYFKTTLRECLWAGLPPGFPSTAPPPVRVSDVLDTLTVWIPNQKKQKLRGQFAKHIIGFVLVETDKLVSSNPHFIFTHQTCGQRSIRVMGSKCRTLAFYFWENGSRERLNSNKMPKISFLGKTHSGVWRVVRGGYGGKACRAPRKIKRLALGVCFPQPCSSAGRRFAASRSLWITTHHFVRFHKNEFDEMLCKLDSTEYARLFEPNPTLPWSPKKNRGKKVIFLERKKEWKNWLLRKRPSCWNLYPRLLPQWASTAGCEGAPPIPTFYHVSCLLLLSCLSLQYVCGLGLCTCSGPKLVCALLLKGGRGLLP